MARVLLPVFALVAAVRAGTPQEHADLASQEIKLTDQYGDNLTATADVPSKGWYNPKICFEDYCVFANREVAGGRGIAIVTVEDEMENLRSLAEHMPQPGSSPPPWPFSAKGEEPGRPAAYVADEALRRGRELIRATPVLIVNQAFFNDTPLREHTRLLEAAVRLLPDATRELFDRQRSQGGRTRNITEIVRAHPFVGSPQTAAHYMSSEPHYFHYPEVGPFTHNCRPNVANFLDRNFVFRSAVARRVQPGDALTISHIYPLKTRAERQEMAGGLWGRPCSCDKCTGGGDLSAISKSDDRPTQSFVGRKFFIVF